MNGWQKRDVLNVSHGAASKISATSSLDAGVSPSPAISRMFNCA